MSKRKKQPVTLLGPDGQPLDLDRLRTERHEERVASAGIDKADGKDATVIVSTAASASYLDELVRSMLTDEGALPMFRRVGKAHPPKPKPLAERVAADVDALTADVDFAGRPELPRPTPDLTAYADALDVAIRSCPHQNVEDTIHSRGEYQCQDCGRYLSREDMRRRASANPFGWYFR